jgi:hypothetical protein
MRRRPKFRGRLSANCRRRNERPPAGFTIEDIFNLTKIDRWFLVQIKEIVDFEEELAATRN